MTGPDGTSTRAARPLSIGVRIPPCYRISTVVEVARRAERLGFDSAWFPDSQLLWRDVFATICNVAIHTDRIGLGTAVTNLVTRHPTVIASAARTVAEMAPGRFALGVGVGDSAVIPAGLKPATQIELRSRIAVVQALLEGEECDLGGVRGRLKDPGPPVPLYLAASGPRNLRLAGELADGLIVLSGISPITLASSLAKVREGAEAAGRSMDDLDVIVSAYGHITDDIERDSRRLKPICAGIAQKGGASFLALADIHLQVPDYVEGVYPDLVHAEDWDLAVERTSEWVSDEMAVRFARTFCLFGTTEDIAAHVRNIQDAGATGIYLQHVGSYSLPHELIESFADALIAP